MSIRFLSARLLLRALARLVDQTAPGVMWHGLDQRVLRPKECRKVLLEGVAAYWADAQSRPDYVSWITVLETAIWYYDSGF